MDTWVSRWDVNREKGAIQQERRSPGFRRDSDCSAAGRSRTTGPSPSSGPSAGSSGSSAPPPHGGKHCWTHEEFTALPYTTVVADLHCVTKFSMLGAEWGGVPARTILDIAPPADDVTHVMVWAEYGFSSNLRLSDFASEQALFATHKDGELLTAEHGFPLRLIVPHLYAWKGPKWVRGVEYMTADRRGFWEERGYHNLGDPWQEQRYSYQEGPGDGPDL